MSVPVSRMSPSIHQWLIYALKSYQKVTSVVLKVSAWWVTILRFREPHLTWRKTSLSGIAGRCEFYTKRRWNGQRYLSNFYFVLHSIHALADKSEFQIISKVSHEQPASPLTTNTAGPNMGGKSTYIRQVCRSPSLGNRINQKPRLESSHLWPKSDVLSRVQKQRFLCLIPFYAELALVTVSWKECQPSWLKCSRPQAYSE